MGMGVATAGLGAAAIGQMVGGAACPATRPCNVRAAVLDLQLNFLIADALSKRPLSPSVLQTDRTRRWPTKVSTEVSLLTTCVFHSNGLFIRRDYHNKYGEEITMVVVM